MIFNNLAEPPRKAFGFTLLLTKEGKRRGGGKFLGISDLFKYKSIQMQNLG